MKFDCETERGRTVARHQRLARPASTGLFLHWSSLLGEAVR
jgi:hypothetical protein